MILLCCSYVSRIKIIAEDFRQAIQAINTKSAKPIVPDSTINIIFLNIGEIYNLNKQLLDDIQSRMDNWLENILSVSMHLYAHMLAHVTHFIIISLHSSMLHFQVRE